MITPLVIGNWKMNETFEEASKLATALSKSTNKIQARATIVIAPPFIYLLELSKKIARSAIGLAGQNCHWDRQGAFTGEISPAMLYETGCRYVIVGHSERRHIFKETDDMIAKKTAAAIINGLRPIVCVGETLDERQNGSTMRVITRQLRSALKGLTKTDIRNIEIAYEPVWAIGTGQNARPEQVGTVHSRIRQYIVNTFGPTDGKRVRILYGGSVNPENARALSAISEVDGLLVGGASLKAETFLPVIRCFDQLNRG
jgi:triosephosphate isomerase (TIM)